MNHAEVKNITAALDAAGAELRAVTAKLDARDLKRGRISLVCGAIVQEGDPCGSLNLRVNNDLIHALAVQIARKRQGR